MLAPMTLKEFYGETLKSAGFTPPEDSIEKFATANKLDPEITKIAARVFEQLQLDGVPYETPQVMFQDAIKIANEYADHVKTTVAAAEKLAGDLHRVARHAVEGYLANNGIDMDADEGVKVAGLQAQSFQKLAQTQAELRQQENKAAEAAKTADPIPGSTSPQYLDGNVPASEATLNEPAIHAGMAARFGGGDPVAYQKYIHSQVPEGSRNGYYNAFHQAAQANPGASFADTHNAAMASGSPAPKPGLLSRPGVMLGAGALGLGALYMMKKKRDEAAAAQNRQGAITGAANMPAA